jgi:hypothetical protein
MQQYLRDIREFYDELMVIEVLLKVDEVNGTDTVRASPDLSRRCSPGDRRARTADSQLSARSSRRSDVFSLCCSPELRTLHLLAYFALGQDATSDERDLTSLMSLRGTEVQSEVITVQ